MLYKVLRAGIRQRTSEGGFSSPKVGDVIKVSDVAAPRLIAKGWIAAHGGPAPAPVAAAPAPAPAPEEGHRRRRRHWLSDEAPPASEPPMPEAATTEPPAPKNEGGLK